MPANPDISRMVDEIREDHSRGAIELARQAAMVLKVAAEQSKASETDRFVHEVLGGARMLTLARPSMAPIRNIVGRLTSAVSSQARAMDLDGLREFTIARADQVLAESHQAVARIAGNALGLVGNGATLLTHSYSSTVLAAIRHIAAKQEGIHVTATRSGPGRAGEEVARQLAGSGVPVTLVHDVVAAPYVARAQAVVLGADAVCSQGVVNGVGSYQIAVLASALKTPVYVLCDSLKFDPALTREDADLEENACQMEVVSGLSRDVIASIPRFDFTPLELLAAVVTETGVLPPQKVPTYLRSISLT